VTTISEVARLAGVSISTVSRVLSDHPDVSDLTRDRVQAVIDRLQYRPSALARGLKAGRARILGLIVSDITNPFYPELIQIIEMTAAERGYRIILCTTADDTRRTAEALEILREYRADGIIHASVRLDDRLDRLLNDPAGPPLVLLNRTSNHDAVTSITVDNRAGGFLATQHLITLGRHSLLHLAGPKWASNALARVAGFRAACTEAGLNGERARVVEVGFSVDATRHRIREALAAGPTPDGLFAVNDSIALAAIEEILDAGLRIPEDVAVIGFDDTHLSGSRFVRLSSIAHNVGEMGTLAGEMLVDHIEGDTGDWPAQVVLEPRLIARGSSVAQEIAR
jgi:LacI family transcriptional regulator